MNAPSRHHLHRRARTVFWFTSCRDGITFDLFNMVESEALLLFSTWCIKYTAYLMLVWINPVLAVADELIMKLFDPVTGQDLRLRPVSFHHHNRSTWTQRTRNLQFPNGKDHRSHSTWRQRQWAGWRLTSWRTFFGLGPFGAGERGSDFTALALAAWPLLPGSTLWGPEWGPPLIT